MTFPPPPSTEPDDLWHTALVWRAVLDLNTKMQDVLKDLGPLDERLPRSIEIISPYLLAQEQMAFDRFYSGILAFVDATEGVINVLQALRERGLR